MNAAAFSDVTLIQQLRNEACQHMNHDLHPSKECVYLRETDNTHLSIMTVLARKVEICLLRAAFKKNNKKKIK